MTRKGDAGMAEGRGAAGMAKSGGRGLGAGGGEIPAASAGMTDPGGGYDGGGDAGVVDEADARGRC